MFSIILFSFCPCNKISITTAIYNYNTVYNTFINFPVCSQRVHRALFGVSVITRTLGLMVGLLWTSDEPVVEVCTYIGQHNIYTQEINIHAPSRIQTRDLSNQAAADVYLRPRGYWDWPNSILSINNIGEKLQDPILFLSIPMGTQKYSQKIMSDLCMHSQSCCRTNSVRHKCFGINSFLKATPGFPELNSKSMFLDPRYKF
jgi:hypothetical protein